MSLARRVWTRLPEGVRDRLRVALYNRRCAPARFALRDGIYRTSYQGQELRTWDHPFELVEGLRRYLRRQAPSAGQVVVDAGAFHGLYALWFAARVGPAGRVVAVEPDPDNLAGLRRNLALNPGLRVEVVEEPLWSGVEELDFFPQANVASSFFWSREGQAAVRRSTTTLDRIVSDLDLPRLDFVKMDVEGAEVHALRGAAESIRRFRPCFAIASYHQVDGGPTYPAVEGFFREAGYRYETVGYGVECMTYGWPG
ncbi:MAG TPA: FkbM family methyltransferase [Thermoanaerobaculia bacterium]|jgi:FkbM family methyltransferase|nr:FkbM family methyltransferase [Thermoanaerobaculia bacterium]